MRAILTVLTMMLFLSSTLRAQTQEWKDDLAIADWKLIPADGVTASIEQVTEGTESFLRLHYSFDRGGGFVVLRRVINLELAENFLLTFDVRSGGPKQNLEIKLLDDAVAPAGGNVWWINRPAYEFSNQWQTVTQRRKHIGFAWGPDSKKPLKSIQAVEFGIASASGGKGIVDFRNLRYEARPPARPIGEVLTLLDGKPVSKTFALGKGAKLDIDFGEMTEIGGLTIECGASGPTDELMYELFSDKGRISVGSVTSEAGFGFVVVLPESECNRIRLSFIGDRALEACKLRVHPPEWSDTPNHFIESLATVLPRGRMPRWASKEQNYWTVCGGLESDAETLISEDGAIELGRAGPTLEPFIQVNGKTLTWADAKISQRLIDDELPLPQVLMQFDAAPGLELSITLIEDQGRFLARYELANQSTESQEATLVLAVRPFQVLPPSQWLNIVGGFVPIRSLKMTDSSVIVNGTLGARFSPPNAELSCVTGLAGDLGTSRFTHSSQEVGFGELKSERLQGMMKFPAMLSPGAKATWIATLGTGGTAATQRDFEQSLESARSRWHDAVNKVQIQLPRSLKDIEQTIRAQQAYILINQDGHGTQPGSRTYERSWIRDGALTSVAMLRLGNADFAKRFLNWYADFQYDNGKIPCVVDKRGSDPVDEHDSTGEYIYAVYTYFAYTNDREFLDRHLPHVRKGVEYLHGLIAQRSTPEYRNDPGIKGAMFGLVPESISHEGYSAKPMHSYWDCYFTSQGLHDAAALALAHGDTQLSKQWTELAKQFDTNLATSIARTQKFHNIAYIPGCVELGDFDATSTAIGVWPCNVLNTAELAPSLHATLDRYTDFFKKRSSGELEWKDCTPYELRLVGVIASERDPEFALTMLNYFMRDQRPGPWRHWAEVVGREMREARFIGDMPHTWCGTEFLNSILNMAILETSNGLEIGAGIPWSIFEPQPNDPLPTMQFNGIRTSAGKVNVRIARTSSTEITVNIEIPDQLKTGTASLRLPPPKQLELLDPTYPVHTSGARASVALRSGQNELRFRATTKR